MVIEIEKLKHSLIEFNELIEEYESVYYNLYNELSNCSTFWSDNKADLFFESINFDKLSINEVINEIKDVISIYNYLVERYSKFGEKIKCDFEMKDIIFDKLDVYLEKIYDLLEDFRRLNFGFDSYISYDVFVIINNLVDITNILINTKNNIKQHFITFEEIEKEINLRVSKINISIIKENEFLNFI